jgi:glycosyltransferase involved in cell wall biosynthesis
LKTIRLAQPILGGAVGTLRDPSVLVIQNMYPPHHHGGYELSCRDTVDRWRRAGRRVSVLVGSMRVAGVADPPGEREQNTWRDLPIAYRDGDLWRPPLRKLIGRERDAQRSLAAALERSQPDVISVWHLAALSTGLLHTLVDTGIPLVYVVCDDWLTYAPNIDPWMQHFERRPRVGKIAQRLLGIPATLPDVGASGTFLFVSEVTRQRAEELSPWSFPRSTVTYSGIDRTDFPEVSAEARPWRSRLLQADRFDPRKGLETSLRALALLPPDTTLDFLGRGDDSYREHIVKLAAELGVAERVTTGAVPRSEMARHYSAADVVLFPTEWDEPFGLTPIEAMACDTPVVATALGGSAEFLIDGVNCLVVPPRDPAAVASAVQRLAGDPALRDRLVRGGRVTAAELNVDRLAEVLWEWHDAAGNRFAGGEPAHRPPPVSP